MNTKLAVVLLAVIAGSAVVGCISNDKSLVIVQDVAVDSSSCTYLDVTSFMGRGTIDLSYFPKAVSYLMPVRLYNNMPASSTSSPDLDTMAVQLHSANVSFEWLSGKNMIHDSLNYPDLAQLADLETHTDSIPISGLLPAAASSGGTPGEVIAPLRVIHGDVGIKLNLLANQDQDTVVSMLVLGVHVTVHGTTQGGMAVSSNDFIFPIDFCQGCLAIISNGTNMGYVCCPDDCDPGTDSISPYCPGFEGQDYGPSKCPACKPVPPPPDTCQ